MSVASFASTKYDMETSTANMALTTMNTMNHSVMKTEKCLGWGVTFARRHRGLTCGMAFAACVAFSGDAEATDLEDVLYGVEQVESGGKDIGRHPDGVTYGRYGVTYMAVRELRRLRWIGTEDVDLMNPASNAKIARLYLTYLKKRYGSWWEAVRHYNPRSKTYARKVWAAMDRRRQKVASIR